MYCFVYAASVALFTSRSAVLLAVEIKLHALWALSKNSVGVALAIELKLIKLVV